MKITPVSGGMPSMHQSSATGLSTEKLDRLKAIAKGETPPEVVQNETLALKDVPTSTTRKIKMNVNRTPEQGLAEALLATQGASESAKEGTDGPLPVVTTAEAVPAESAISDTDVQAKSPVESTGQISPQLAALMKRERALQVKERELAEKEKAMSVPDASLASLKERALNGQALSALVELGIPEAEVYQRIFDEVTGNKTDYASAQAIKRVEALEKSLDEKLAKRDSDQEQAVYSHMSRNIGIITRTNPEFRFIKESKSEDAVLELIKQEWKQNGEILDEEEACKRIELELREDARRYAGILGELEQPPKAPAEKAKEPVEQKFKTLTNKDSARPVMTRRQRSLAAFLGQK